MAYIYRHIRLDKNEPFYIGIGTKPPSYNNFKTEFRRAYKYSERNILWDRIRSKAGYEVEILLDDLTWEEACAKEIEFINLYGRKNLNTGILSNLTDGGEGSPNTIVSLETRLLLSKIRTGGKRTEAVRKKLSLGKMGEKNHMFGKKQSKETISKRVQSIKANNKVYTPEIRLQISMKNTQRINVFVYKYDTNEFVGEYHSICEACRQLGGHNSKASMAMRGLRSQHNGYIYRKTKISD